MGNWDQDYGARKVLLDVKEKSKENIQRIELNHWTPSECPPRNGKLFGLKEPTHLVSDSWYNNIWHHAGIGLLKRHWFLLRDDPVMMKCHP